MTNIPSVPPTMHYGEYPDGRIVGLFDLGSAGPMVVPVEPGSDAERLYREVGTRWVRQGDHWVYGRRVEK